MIGLGVGAGAVDKFRNPPASIVGTSGMEGNGAGRYRKCTHRPLRMFCV
jgi:hypothetical protein